MKEGERSIHIRRKAFSPASLGDLFIGCFFLAWFVFFLLVIILRYPYEIGGYVLLAASGILMFFGFFIGYDRAMVARFEMDEAGVRMLTKDRSREMLWGPEVKVDVVMSGGRSDPTHGHLHGYRFLGDHLIEIDPREGWRIEDIRQAWPTIIDILNDKDVQFQDGLKEYLEERKALGLDQI